MFSNAHVELPADMNASLTTVVARLSPIISPIVASQTVDFRISTEVWLNIWDHVFFDDRYQRHDWVVKVDPATVFFPDRLRKLLNRGQPPNVSAYYNNGCLHGECIMTRPIEVVSVTAVNMFRSQVTDCAESLSLERGIGFESVFLSSCLRLLQVKELNNSVLLSDPSCNEASTCSSRGVAFYPFNTSAEVFKCLWGS